MSDKADVGEQDFVESWWKVAGSGVRGQAVRSGEELTKQELETIIKKNGGR